MTPIGRFRSEPYGTFRPAPLTAAAAAMTYKRAPYSQTSPDTLDVVIEQEKHRPLDAARHAEVVAFITRNNPRAWRVLFGVNRYLYDERDHMRSVTIENQAQDLRIRFNFETDWRAAMEILRTLIRLDREAARMSIGCIIDGREILGEALGVG